CQHGFGVPFTF
nr:immunoglobulin light chain junction region [Macaca mulatta]